jgi:hypothetical protein
MCILQLTLCISHLCSRFVVELYTLVTVVLAHLPDAYTGEIRVREFHVMAFVLYYLLKIRELSNEHVAYSP